ncbi:uncharacterized protein BKA55DRAFT_723881 [Fusarium redolens]|uniref:F-box domain-containing protein n=1 Tax=Fusarium redolens TaxID=48865 RepID=A0A9P9HKQ6_FUSRE|nr:uncharacterized protein BKA55DRAFT_723881 [Fusarium redolens]KAH7259026.1 hypothetical protein BKA55DRAFT_723881 [Fusarium redolens]
MTAFLDVVSDGFAIEDYIEGQRALDLRTPWDKTPKEIEMDHESQMERHIGSEPLIPTQGTELAQYLGPQKDQLASSQCEHSMFQRVPDEILLMIVSNISDPSDKPSLFAFYALRQMVTETDIRCQSVHRLVTIASSISQLEKRRSWQGQCGSREDGRLEDLETSLGSPRVFATNYSGYGIMLHILWQGHSGSDPSILHQSGYLHRHKLNESLKKIRQKGGRHLLPQSGTNTLPEWNAISEIDRSEVVSTEEDLIKLRGGWGYMNRERRHDLTHLGPERIACGHCKNDKSCIVVNYHSKIRFTDGGFHGPPHEWFHAIDRKSYVYNGTVGVPETCHDDGCRNYYKGKDDQVDQWSQMVNWFCEIGDNHSGDRSCTFADKPKQPYEDGRPAFTPWDLYKVKGSEEALAPSASPICFYLNRLTTGILGSFDREHWRTGRAQFSAD